MHSLPPRTEIERLYRILELDPDSSSALVDASWRKLVDEWRPDRFVSDPILYTRAHARINDLNRAHDLLKVYLANELSSAGGSTIRSGNVAQARTPLQRTLIVSTAFAGVAVAALLIARPSSQQPDKAVHNSTVRAASETSPVADRPTSEIQLVAHAPLTVSVSLVANGRILLPETTLYAGQTTTIPRLGPTYIKYSAGENLAVKIDGHLYAMPDTGPNRAKIN